MTDILVKIRENLKKLWEHKPQARDEDGAVVKAPRGKGFHHCLDSSVGRALQSATVLQKSWVQIQFRPELNSVMQHFKSNLGNLLNIKV